jgi:hypothetical protein
MPIFTPCFNLCLISQSEQERPLPEFGAASVLLIEKLTLQLVVSEYFAIPHYPDWRLLKA